MTSAADCRNDWNADGWFPSECVESSLASTGDHRCENRFCRGRLDEFSGRRDAGRVDTMMTRSG